MPATTKPAADDGTRRRPAMTTRRPPTSDARRRQESRRRRPRSTAGRDRRRAGGRHRLSVFGVFPASCSRQRGRRRSRMAIRKRDVRAQRARLAGRRRSVHRNSQASARPPHADQSGGRDRTALEASRRGTAEVLRDFDKAKDDAQRRSTKRSPRSKSRPKATRVNRCRRSQNAQRGGRTPVERPHPGAEAET